MVSRVKIFRTLIAAPVLCLGLLGAVGVDQLRQVPPPEADAYHANVKKLVDEQTPWMIPSAAQPKWTGRPWDVPAGAQRLLKPNAIVARQYTDSSIAARPTRPRDGKLLLIQCKDSSDMDGHWPPNCYPNKGENQEFEAARDWKVGGHDIKLTEYHFAQVTAEGTVRKCVYNFLIIPGMGTTRRMEDVREASANYKQRYYGSAQVQVIMDGDLPPNEREEIFTDLVTPLSNIITAINSPGGLK